jgi:hypothetical protein
MKWRSREEYNVSLKQKVAYFKKDIKDKQTFSQTNQKKTREYPN